MRLRMQYARGWNFGGVVLRRDRCGRPENKKSSVVEVSSDEVDKVVIAAALAQHRRSLH
jgi:Na+-transporting methylmalonyl-CoA/oxaloacetate decarboxylase gamma subunit